MNLNLNCNQSSTAESLAVRTPAKLLNDLDYETVWVEFTISQLLLSLYELTDTLIIGQRTAEDHRVPIYLPGP